MAETGNGRAHGASVRVLRVAPREVCVVVFLGPPIGHLEHWTGKRSVPCLGESDCDKAFHRLRSVFYAYAPVGHFDPTDGSCRPAVLQLTSNLEEQFRGMALRGQVWSLRRDESRGKTGRIDGLFLEQRALETLPEPFPVMPPLLRMFGVPKLCLGAKNPNPAPLILENFQVEPFKLSRIDTEPAEPRRPTEAEVAAFREQLRRNGARRGSH